MADPIQRVNYFRNQFLHVEDFTTEQAYHTEARRRHNRTMHTFGVADGLRLAFTPGGTAVTIRPGTAIDNQGREIVLVEDETKELSDYADGADAYVTIAYDEVATRERDETGVSGHTRVEERPRIETFRTKPAEGARILLGRVTRGGTSKREVTGVDESERSQAGAIEGDVLLTPRDPAIPAGDWVPLRWTGAKQADLTGILRVRKGAATTPDGHVAADGSVGVDQANRNAGDLASGALTFGAPGTGEGIVSKRTAGGNQAGLDLVTRGVSRLSISNAGTVGIGTGAQPAGAPLEVRGWARVGALAFVDGAGAVFPDGWIGMAANIEAATRWLHIGGITDAGARRLALFGDRVFVSGSLGIGTAQPARRLHVEGTEIHSGGANGGYSFGERGVAGLSDVAGQRWVLYGLGGIARLWASGFGDRLGVVAATGNLGIGTTAPEARLHVAGGDVRWAESLLTADQGGSLELGGRNNAAGGGTPYIDFHFGTAVQDFNTRLINDADRRLSVSATTFRQNALCLTGTTGWSSITYNAHHSPANNAWVPLDPARRSVTLEMDDTGGFSRFEVWLTQQPGVAFSRRLAINGTTGVITFDGQLQVNAGKNAYVMDQFVNNLDDAVEQGDVVVLADSAPPHYYGTEGQIPIPEVDLTDRPYDRRVCGVVEGAQGSVRRAPTRGGGKGDEPELETVLFDGTEGDDLDKTRVEPGQVGTFVTLGAYAYCKVDADIAPIEVGDLLTTSPTKGHAQKVLEADRGAGAVVGKAMAPLAAGKEKIPVFVTLH